MNSLKRRWLAVALVFSVYLLSTPFWTRGVTEALREQGLLRVSLAALVIMLLCIAVREGWRNKPLTKVRIGVLAFSLVGYAWLLWPGHLKAWEEAAHFIHVGILAQLFLRALGRMWWSAGVAGLLGLGEEIIQLWVPGRFFDWHDVQITALASLLAAGLLFWRGDPT